ncbi:unnamed protein product [Cyclocybe aegerita]|uniref:Uncharacterized protein n=1 Tax=Cyclocybe aegerita TaxID=1973307 RepID=A0A8S0X1S3_CYCAE|nr:unnamed protein product [Cyclocybe aegerita]
MSSSPISRTADRFAYRKTAQLRLPQPSCKVQTEAEADCMRSPGSISLGIAVEILENENGGSPVSSYQRSSPLRSSSPFRDCSSPIALPHDDAEDDDDDTLLDCINAAVPPLSSSPPEFSSSSPQSAHSSESNNGSFCSSTSTSDSLPSTWDEFIAPAPLDEAPGDNKQDGFGRHLHDLLLVALKERELAGSHIGQATPHHSGGQVSAGSPPTRSKWFADPILDIPAQETAEKAVQELSPIRFEEPEKVYESPVGKCITDHYRPIYRVIKNAGSFIPSSIAHDAEPLTKRQKTRNDAGAHARDRIYAQRSASLRRAESLKSVYDDGRQMTSAEEVPTVPATPVVEKTAQSPERHASSTHNALLPPVPIIAPPEGHVASLPLSPETLAKVRLRKFLEKEEAQRRREDLPCGESAHPPEWMLEDLIDLELCEDEADGRDEISLEWERVLGVGQGMREEVIAWIIEVLPIPLSRDAIEDKPSPPKCTTPNETSSPATSTSTTATTTTKTTAAVDTKFAHLGFNLFDQLKNSPQTRFHAAWMFLRYFYLTMSPEVEPKESKSKDSLSRQSSLDSITTTSTEREGRDLVVWDIAVGCLSLSVKVFRSFHRDFLNPLIPVYAHEYLSLSPHNMSHEDLETTHRDILSALDYTLGVTPQLLMDELWFSLPSLQALLDFDGGWPSAMADAWRFLFDALKEPDILKYPISLLTVLAVMNGITEGLVRKYRFEDMTEGQEEGEEGSPANAASPEQVRRPDSPTSWIERAKEEAEGVLCDIQALVGITDVRDLAQLRECRAWGNTRIKR